MCIDLHLHSIHSDGSSTPKELLEMAGFNGVTALALTDHDTMAGVHELLLLGKNKKIQVLSGIEVSARYENHSIHILGYGLDPNNPEFHDWLKQLQAGREERNTKITQTLDSLGIAITQKELEDVSATGLTGRPHIANILVKKGVVRTHNEAFKRYLGKGKKAWHCRFCYSARETITAIHNAGGVAVLAHPGQIDRSMKAQPTIIQQLAAYGLDGIEVVYPTHSKNIQAHFKELAKSNGLLITGGSDYHGPARPMNKMARVNSSFCPPENLLPPILEKIATYH